MKSEFLILINQLSAVVFLKFHIKLIIFPVALTNFLNNMNNQIGQ